MSIYEQYINGIKKGKWHAICLKKSEMRLGRMYLIRDGTYNGTLHDTLPNMTQDEVITEIERLYAEYKHSLPSRKSRDHYFKAIPYEELTDWEMVNGEQREIAQARLEAFILCSKLMGKIQFDGWFWKSSVDTDLVILKSWIQ